METVPLTMVKTFVMFIGELEYDNIFFDNVNPYNGPHYGEKLPYPIFSLFFLVAFLCIMPLIIMNLLVSVHNELEGYKALFKIKFTLKKEYF